MKNENSLWPVVTIIAVILLGIVTILSLFAHSQGGTSGTTSNRTITVTATGSATGQPSEEILYLTVNGTAATSQNAVANLTSTMTTLNRTLYGYVDDNTSKIATTSYYVSAVCNDTSYPIPMGAEPNYVYRYGCTANSIVTYEAVESLTVTMPNATNAGAAVNAISAVHSAYINNIYAQFTNAQVAALRPVALSNAMSNATAQARATLGSKYNISVLNVTVGSYNFFPEPLYSAGASSGGVAQAVIYPGTDSVTESVTVVFSYQK